MNLCETCGQTIEGLTCPTCMFVKPDVIEDEPLHKTLDRLRSAIVSDLTAAIESVRTDDLARANQLVYHAYTSLDTFQLLVEDYR